MRRKARPGGGRQIETTIERLGGQGDGVSAFEGRPLFVPGALAGERVRLRIAGERGGGWRGELLELIEPGPARRAPPCPHFGPCGGCGLQHLEEGAYAAWKRDQVVQALERRGLDPAVVGELQRISPATRRRAVLSAGRDRTLQIGFLGRGSHRIEDLQSCLILTPALLALISPLRAALDPLIGPKERWGLVAAETESGVDLCLQTRRAPGLADLEALAALAETSDLARVSWQDGEGEPEPVAVRRAPRVTFGQVPVTPPPGGFLQPSRESEAVLSELVLGHVPEGATAVADLYSGCGTFAFRLSERARVKAVEGDAAARAALEAAARAASLADRVGSERRDLARRPLIAEELASFDCVVFDPPRAGAKAQAEELARSSVPRAVAVSCHPASFARDARILVDGGYRLTAVTPLDQFPWSAHVELVACFEK